MHLLLVCQIKYISSGCSRNRNWCLSYIDCNITACKVCFIIRISEVFLAMISSFSFCFQLTIIFCSLSLPGHLLCSCLSPDHPASVSGCSTLLLISYRSPSSGPHNFFFFFFALISSSSRRDRVFQ